MNQADVRSGGGGKDAATLNGCARRIGPAFPYGSKAKQVLLCQPYPPRLFCVAIGACPFVKAVSWEDTATILEGASKGRFLSYGFGPCIDHTATNGGIFCPRGDETPSNVFKGPLVSIGLNRKNLVGGGHVVGGSQINS